MPGKIVFVAQGQCLAGLVAEVFGDDGDVAEPSADGGEELVAGDGKPLAADGIFRAGGDGPDAMEAKEMIDAGGVELAEEALEPRDPPVESFVDVGRPAIVGMSPDLPEGSERIGRIAGNGDGITACVELKKILASPDGGRVM